jgi:UV DNA damage endonuclease
MGLDTTAKIQIHVGGVYGDKSAGMDRFVRRYDLLDTALRRRLVIENDERLYSVADCLDLHERTGVPVLFDAFHHSLNNNGERVSELLGQISAGWDDADGIPMVDYSSQEPGKRVGSHAEHIDEEDFAIFIGKTRGFDLDIMLEIKDKEASAARALAALQPDPRLVPSPSTG